MNLPTGTVTFLFTDIEGSTRLMQEVGDRYVKAQTDHHEILRRAFTGSRGRELRTEGDSFFCVFESAVDACDAAAQAQREFASHEWPEGVTLRVRVGLHTGEAPLVGDEYIGLDVHHAARVAAAAHGGQVVLSETTRVLVEERLADGLSVRDLGTHRLKDLARPEQLYQLVISGAPDQFPPLRTLDSTPNNLPTQLTSFVGRDQDVAEAKRLLTGSRLLTLTGPGGIGKTRLSLQLAADVVQDFRDGVYFVPLSAVNDPALIASVIVNVLGVSVGNRAPVEVLNEHLRDLKLLLVLDNYEQLLPDGATVVSEMLHASAGLKVVVSSRAVLHVYGEQEMGVKPLRLPDPHALPPLAALSQFEAVKLFIERAVAVKADFQVTNENAPAVAGICERVDGLPLAIELAAARVKLFAPHALLARLEKSLQVLGTGSRDLPGRQQTLAGAIAWSYDLLDEPHRRLFRRFSVFGRGANLEQAEAVCGGQELGVDVLTGLDELADQSLLRRMPDFDEPRLLMLQVVREYAAERLAESSEAGAIKDRHAAAYQALAEAAAPNLFGPDRKLWLDRLERDHDNFRAAFDWAMANHDAARAMCLSAAFWRFWQMRGHIREGRARMEAILAMSTDPTDERARALEAAGGVAYWQADMDAAQRWYDEHLVIVRASGDKRRLADALYNTSFPKLVGRSDLSAALDMVTEALAIFKELGDAQGAARSQWSIGNALYFFDRNPEAAVALDEAIALNRQLGNRFSLGWALHTRALVALKLGDVRGGHAWTRQGMEIFCEAQDLSGMTILLDDAASVAEREGDMRAALKMAGGALASRTTTGTDLAGLAGLNDGRDWHASVTSADEEVAWSEGTNMSVQDATAYALGWLA